MRCPPGVIGLHPGDGRDVWSCACCACCTVWHRKGACARCRSIDLRSPAPESIVSMPSIMTHGLLQISSSAMLWPTAIGASLEATVSAGGTMSCTTPNSYETPGPVCLIRPPFRDDAYALAHRHRWGRRKLLQIWITKSPVQACLYCTE